MVAKVEGLEAAACEIVLDQIDQLGVGAASPFYQGPRSTGRWVGDQPQDQGDCRHRNETVLIHQPSGDPQRRRQVLA